MTTLSETTTTCRCPAFKNADGTPSTHAIGLQDRLGNRYCDSSAPQVRRDWTPGEVAEFARLLAALDGRESWTCPACESENHHTYPAEGCTSCPWVQDEN